MKNRPAVISLFSGAGGLDYGFEAAGFDTAVCVEMNHDACETLRRSRPDWAVIEDAIENVSSEDLARVGRLRTAGPTVLIGGPPCQPFSKSGYWATGDSARLEDPRADTLTQYLRVLEDLKPDAFLLENVVGLRYSGKDEGLTQLLDGIRAINRRQKTKYSYAVNVLNAVDFGVPQMRERLFIIGARDGTPFEFPTPTCGEQMSLFGDLQPYTTAWDAIGDLEDNDDEALAPRGRWAELVASIPEGQNYLWHTDRGVDRARTEGQRPGKHLFGWRRRYWTFLLKLAKERPSWTIQAQPGPSVGPFHWKNRRLSTAEICRLQTFPRDVKIFGSRMSAQKQVGNAVPSLLAEVLARAIATQLLHLPRASGALKLAVQRAKVTPPPEAYVDPLPHLRVSKKDRTPHPGTGLGPLGRRRAAV